MKNISAKLLFRWRIFFPSFFLDGKYILQSSFQIENIFPKLLFRWRIVFPGLFLHEEYFPQASFDMKNVSGFRGLTSPLPGLHLLWARWSQLIKENNNRNKTNVNCAHLRLTKECQIFEYDIWWYWWYLVVLGQYRAVRVDIWCYRVSMKRDWLIHDNTGSVEGDTG